MSRLTEKNLVIAKEIIARYPRQKSALIPLLHLSLIHISEPTRPY